MSFRGVNASLVNPCSFLSLTRRRPLLKRSLPCTLRFHGSVDVVFTGSCSGSEFGLIVWLDVGSVLAAAWLQSQQWWFQLPHLLLLLLLLQELQRRNTTLYICSPAVGDTRAWALLDFTHSKWCGSCGDDTRVGGAEEEGKDRASSIITVPKLRGRASSARACSRREPGRRENQLGGGGGRGGGGGGGDDESGCDEEQRVENTLDLMRLKQESWSRPHATSVHGEHEELFLTGTHGVPGPLLPPSLSSKDFFLDFGCKNDFLNVNHWLKLTTGGSSGAAPLVSVFSVDSVWEEECFTRFKPCRKKHNITVIPS